MKYLLPLFPLFLLAALSCTPANGPVPTEQAIMPLAVGNLWIGKITQYNDSGSNSTWLDTLRIEKSQSVHGRTWYYMNVFWLSDDTGHRWFTNMPDGLYSCDTGHFDRAWRFAKYPAMPGERVVTFVDTTYGPLLWEVSGREVDTTNFSVTVPAGTYSTNVYGSFDRERHYDVLEGAYMPGEYYAPGVGPVQFGYFNSDGSHNQYVHSDRTWQLVRAELH